jgi:hypothetical protein
VLSRDASQIYIIQQLAATLALLAAAGWILVNYVLNRTHVPRLQVELRAELLELNDGRYLMATMQAKNHGLSRIKLPKAIAADSGPEGSALTIFPLGTYDNPPYVVQSPPEPDAAVSTFAILVGHKEVEPGITISEQKLLQLPDNDYDAYQVQITVSAERWFRLRRQRWFAVAIAARGVRGPRITDSEGKEKPNEH